jgi:hypothetical protein
VERPTLPRAAWRAVAALTGVLLAPCAVSIACGHAAQAGKAGPLWGLAAYAGWAVIAPVLHTLGGLWLTVVTPLAVLFAARLQYLPARTTGGLLLESFVCPFLETPAWLYVLVVCLAVPLTAFERRGRGRRSGTLLRLSRESGK